jgi:hypothetical protein
MNIYVVVEGSVEEKVYKRWIPYVNDQITYSGSNVSDLSNNNFAIISGHGYPYYKEVICDAIIDVNDGGNVDKLVIAIDSEEMTREEKYSEIQGFIQTECEPSRTPIFIVTQHFCIETWALGNRSFGPVNPIGQKLREYKRIHCVFENDPELLPSNPPKYRTRAQFAKEYLRAMINDKNRGLSYSERRPNVIYPKEYFDAIKLRYETAEHIVSFSSFYNAFTNI